MFYSVDIQFWAGQKEARHILIYIYIGLNPSKKKNTFDYSLNTSLGDGNVANP